MKPLLQKRTSLKRNAQNRHESSSLRSNVFRQEGEVILDSLAQRKIVWKKLKLTEHAFFIVVAPRELGLDFWELISLPKSFFDLQNFRLQRGHNNHGSIL